MRTSVYLYASEVVQKWLRFSYDFLCNILFLSTSTAQLPIHAINIHYCAFNMLFFTVFGYDTSRRLCHNPDSQTKVERSPLDALLLTFIYVILMEHARLAAVALLNQKGILTWNWFYRRFYNIVLQSGNACTEGSYTWQTIKWEVTALLLV
jgi:hypothetical protein